MTMSDNEEDDDMADLFSFGNEDAAEQVSVDNPSGTSTASPSAFSAANVTGEVSPMSTMMAMSSSSSNPSSPRNRKTSSDSFSEFLEAQTGFLGGESSRSGGAPLSPRSPRDDETQQMLDWLEDDDIQKSDETNDPAASTASTSNTASTSASSTPTNSVTGSTEGSAATSTAVEAPAPPPAAAAPAPTVVSLPPLFSTLEEALDSKESTTEQVRQLCLQEQQKKRHDYMLSHHYRAALYSRLVANKHLENVGTSSLADAFLNYCQHAEEGFFLQQHLELSLQVAALTQRDAAACQDELNRILSYHYSSNQNINQNSSSTSAEMQPQKQTSAEQTKREGEASDAEAKNDSSQQIKNEDTLIGDLLLPPVAAAILAAITHPSVKININDNDSSCSSDDSNNKNTRTAAASVLLTNMIPTYMPLFALQASERYEATCDLHQAFYLLACYHIPLLVLHLDRYLPGWYWPLASAAIRKQQEHLDYYDSLTDWNRNVQQHGRLSPSWLTTTAGDCAWLETVLYIWDVCLAHPPATRFFLLLALLEPSADALLLLTGDELSAALKNVLVHPDKNLRRSSTSSTDEEGNDDNNNVDNSTLLSWVQEWWSRATALQSQTPASVWKKLQMAEDEAVQRALLRRQQRAQAALQARLRAEAEAHLREQEAKAQAARDRLTRARLVAYYREHAPEKEGNIDAIMETFAGKFDVLDGKLKLKYGVGFNPALKPKSTTTTTTLLSSMNRRPVKDPNKQEHGGEDENNSENDRSGPSEQVSVLVSAAEVLPIVCWTREAAAARGQQRRRRLTDRPQLKFYLVDGRSEDAASEQGRFPTAIHLSPETLMDPEKLKQNEESFESLRGAVHIVIMGEGWACMPDMYGHKLTPKLEELMREDESRTNICALFFVKKGFPFVSVLNGGFAAAHSWLVRHGPSQHLTASQVLVDYDPDASLFGQLESLHNASSATEKASRKMQMVLDKSMAAMTKRALQIERLADHLDSQDGRQSLRLAEAGLKNAFAGIRGSFSTEMESVDLSSPVQSGDGTGGEDNQESSAAASAFQATPLARWRSNDGLKEAAASQAAPLGRWRSNDGLKEAAAAATTQTQKEALAHDRQEQAVSPSAPAAPEAAPAQNRFTTGGMLKGLGTAINQTMKQANTAPTEAKPAPAIRNPFARFGGGAAAANTNTTTSTSPAAATGGGGGFGLNTFRRAAMARIRTTGTAAASAGDESSGEESISFPSASTATIATIPASPPQKERAEVQQV